MLSLLTKPSKEFLRLGAHGWQKEYKHVLGPRASSHAGLTLGRNAVAFFQVHSTLAVLHTPKATKAMDQTSRSGSFARRSVKDRFIKSKQSNRPVLQ